MICMALSLHDMTLVGREDEYRWFVYSNGAIDQINSLDDLCGECGHCVVAHGEKELDDLFEKELVVLSAPKGYSPEDIAEAFMFRELHEVQC